MGGSLSVSNFTLLTHQYWCIRVTRGSNSFAFFEFVLGGLTCVASEEFYFLGTYLNNGTDNLMDLSMEGGITGETEQMQLSIQ